jgi:hypothetical protein
VKWPGWGAPVFRPRQRGGVRPGSDSTGGECIVLISSISRRGKDEAAPDFGSGRGCMRRCLVPHAKEVIGDARWRLVAGSDGL